MGEQKRKQRAKQAQEQARRERLAHLSKGREPVARQDGTAANTVRDDGSGFPANAWMLADDSLTLWANNWRQCLVLFLLPQLVLYTGVAVMGHIGHLTWRVAVGGIIILLGGLWLLLSLVPTLYFVTHTTAGKAVTIRQAYRHGFTLMPRAVGLTLLIGLLMVLGVFAFVIPGLFAFRRYFLSPYYLVHRNVGIRQAMAQSARDSKAFPSYIWGVAALAVVIFPIAATLIATIRPPFGAYFGLALNAVYLFGPALRYHDIVSRLRAKNAQAATAHNKR